MAEQLLAETGSGQVYIPPASPSHVFVSQLSSSVVVSVPSLPSPAPSPRQSGSFGPLALAALDPSIDLLLHFQTLPRGRTRNAFLRGLLEHCERDELLLLSTLLAPRLKRDFLGELPPELALHVLSFVEDAQTLARVSCVSKSWRNLLADEHLWRTMSDRYNFNVAAPGPAGSFRRQFRRAYLTERNWRGAGRLVKSNRTPDEGIVTSLAMDDELVVVGFNNHNVNLYDVHSGAKTATLLGHQQGVWAICLVSRGGRLLDPSEHAPVPLHTPTAPPPSSSVSMPEPEQATAPALGLGLGFAEPGVTLARMYRDEYATGENCPMPAAADAEALRSDVCGATRGWGQPDAVVVSGSSDRTVRVWNARTGECVHILSGHGATIRCMKALQNRPIVVSGSRDSTLKVWDIERGVLLRTMVGHTDSVRCLDVFANQVVSGSYDTELKLWDVDTGQCLRTFHGHTQPIYAVSYDGTRIASGGLDQITRVWSAEYGWCQALLQGHNSLVCRLQLSPHRLCTGGADGRLLVFDVSQNYALTHRLAPHALTSLAGLQFMERGAAAGCLANDLLVSAANDGRVVLTDLRTGAEVRELSEKCDQVWCVGFRNDRLVVVCSRHSKTVVELWSFRPEDEDRPDA
ncbi:WD40 repeat-like protein [Auricularia subglabra TFB-10046 SS5]|uniref:WD40 repeat-like protein n=1 Tax=Auricularia subglabra (strain TFB-10046 / SS5) TaxID=717982 RepID=J0WUQ8_AURST|nr:WD40 repeat-like protein [Auricularia subglabra TFB-10046 SS5]